MYLSNSYIRDILLFQNYIYENNDNYYDAGKRYNNKKRKDKHAQIQVL